MGQLRSAEESERQARCVATIADTNLMAVLGPSQRRWWLVPEAAAAMTAFTWLWATASGWVPLEGAGDEAGRILHSYTIATPGRLVSFLGSGDSWTAIHPPLDVAFRAVLNATIGAVADSPDALVRVNQVVATLLVIVGVGATAIGLRRREDTSIAVYLALACSSASMIYVAHHALSENLAVALVGLGARRLMAGHTKSAGWLVGVAGLVRPEVALVFATLAAFPVADRQWRRAVVFGGLAAGPALAHTLATEIAGTSYATVDLWANRSLFGVAFRGTGPEVYWGLGIAPRVALVAAVVLVMTGVAARVPVLSTGRLLIVGWAGWNLVFAFFAARGAIPTQIRTYVALHLLGAVALAVAAGEIFGNVTWRPAVSRRAGVAVSLTAAAVIAVAMVLTSTTRREWRNSYPSDVRAVNRFLAETGDGGAILTDWMSWREWTVGVYGARPGGHVCNYALCTDGSESVPPSSMTAGLTSFEFERLTQAWRFLAEERVDFITMFDDEAYADWQAWYLDNHPQVLSSFVRPLLVERDGCFDTVDALPYARFCSALNVGRYLVLERID